MRVRYGQQVYELSVDPSIDPQTVERYAQLYGMKIVSSSTPLTPLGQDAYGDQIFASFQSSFRTQNPSLELESRSRTLIQVKDKKEAQVRTKADTKSLRTDQEYVGIVFDLIREVTAFFLKTLLLSAFILWGPHFLRTNIFGIIVGFVFAGGKSLKSFAMKCTRAILGFVGLSFSFVLMPSIASWIPHAKYRNFPTFDEFRYTLSGDLFKIYMIAIVMMLLSVFLFQNNKPEEGSKTP